MGRAADKLIRAKTASEAAAEGSVEYLLILEATTYDLAILDVRDLSNITRVGAIDTSNSSTYHFTVDGDYVYVAERTNDKISQWDVSDLTTPVSVASYTNASTTAGINEILSVEIDTDSGVLMAGGRTNQWIASLTITAPEAFTLTDRINDGNWLQWNSNSEIDTVNKIYYTSTGGSSLGNIAAIDYSDPTAIFKASHYRNSGFITRPGDLSLDATTDTLYICCENRDNLVAIDVSNPASMSVKSSLSGFNRPVGLALDIDRELAFVSSRDGDQIHSIDISNPASMSILDSWGVADDSTFDFPHDIVLDTVRELAFVTALGGGKMFIIDYSTPTALSLDSTTTAVIPRQYMGKLR